MASGNLMAPHGGSAILTENSSNTRFSGVKSFFAILQVMECKDSILLPKVH